MTFIKRITVSGFRGILTPLELSFVKGGNNTSMTLFGRNGFGKSSLTDAWSGCKRTALTGWGGKARARMHFRIEEQPVTLPMLK